MKSLFPVVLIALVLMWPAMAEANRPFLTDDSGVVEPQELEIQLWAELAPGSPDDTFTVAPLFNAQASVSPFESLEFSFGGGLGMGHDGAFTVVNPTLESKIELLEVGEGFVPGIGFVAGVLPRLGFGDAYADETTVYAIVPATIEPTDRLEIHANAGWITAIDDEGLQSGRPYWGLAAAISPFCPCWAIAVEAVAGDPAEADGPPIAGQLGLRWEPFEGASFETGFIAEPGFEWMAHLGTTIVLDWSGH